MTTTNLPPAALDVDGVPTSETLVNSVIASAATAEEKTSITAAIYQWHGAEIRRVLKMQVVELAKVCAHDGERDVPAWFGRPQFQAGRFPVLGRCLRGGLAAMRTDPSRPAPANLQRYPGTLRP